MNKLEAEEGYADRQNAMQVRLMRIETGKPKPLFDDIHSEVGVFENAQRNQVERNNKTEHQLFMGSCLGDQRHEQEVAQSQTENEKTVNRLPRHVEDVACHQKQWHPQFVRNNPEE